LNPRLWILRNHRQHFSRSFVFIHIAGCTFIFRESGQGFRMQIWGFYAGISTLSPMSRAPCPLSRVPCPIPQTLTHSYFRLGGVIGMTWSLEQRLTSERTWRGLTATL
jgi:hypothetical protein